MNKTKNGFTILEIMAVLLIVGIIMALIGVGFSVARKRAKESQTKARLEKIRMAIEEYRIEYGAYPEQANEDTFENVLAALSADESSLIKNAVQDLRLNDSWGNPIWYQRENTPQKKFIFRLWSTGERLEDKHDDVY